jgi:sec-independent protein translocase protein TatC
MTTPDNKALFSDHLEALRHTLIRILILIASGTTISFFFYSTIISFLISPLITKTNSKTATWIEERIEHIHLKNNSETTLTYQLPDNFIDIIKMSPNVKQFGQNIQIPSKESLTYTQTVSTQGLFVLGPLEGMLIALKISLWVGIVLTSPLWLFVLLQFIAPALHGHEKRLILPFLLISLVLMIIGGCFAFKVTIPLANEYLSAFNQAIGINLWSLKNYLDYTFVLLFANSLAFEFCVIGIFAVHLGVVSYEKLRAHRRWAIVLAFVMGAILTPPDVFTQLMLAIPLMIFYELIILYARFRKLN